jgi:hypothetical protein
VNPPGRERLSRKATGKPGSIQIRNELEGGISAGVVGRAALPVSGGGSAVGDMVAVSDVVGTNGCG